MPDSFLNALLYDLKRLAKSSSKLIFDFPGTTNNFSREKMSAGVLLKGVAESKITILSRHILLNASYASVS